MFYQYIEIQISKTHCQSYKSRDNFKNIYVVLIRFWSFVGITQSSWKDWSLFINKDVKTWDKVKGKRNCGCYGLYISFYLTSYFLSDKIYTFLSNVRSIFNAICDLVLYLLDVISNMTLTVDAVLFQSVNTETARHYSTLSSTVSQLIRKRSQQKLVYVMKSWFGL